MRTRLCILLPVVAIVLWGQSENRSNVRGMWNEAFAAKRPGTPKVAQGTDKAAVTAEESTFLGVTVWRMRPAKKADPTGVRLLVHRAEKADEFTPVRVSAGTPLSQGERIRMTIESTNPGYLYVISREVYADGSRGTPYLVYPAGQLRGGSNRVEPGRVIELPSWTDLPPYLTLEKSRPDHVSEQVMFLVSPERIPDLMATRDPVALSEDRLDSWEKRWGLNVEVLDLPSEVGEPMTEREKSAATEGKLLVQGDPVPQTLYRANAEENAVLLAAIQLAFQK
jgi:hypothetical protein